MGLRDGEEIEDDEGSGDWAGHERRVVSRDGDGDGLTGVDDEGWDRSRSRSHKRRRLSIESGPHEAALRGGPFPTTTTTKKQRDVIAISSSPPPPPSSSSSSSSCSSPLSPSDNADPDPHHNPIIPAPELPQPAAPNPPHRPPPRFVFPPTTPSLPAIPSSPSIFLRPAAPAVDPGTHDPPLPPLPELFSPHRRGHKFQPDGLAATVRDWVVAVAQEAVASRNRSRTRGWGNGGVESAVEGEREGEGDGVRMRVVEVRGGGGGDGDGDVVLVRATSGDGEVRKWMLLGSGGMGTAVRAGVVVVVRAPVWEVEVRGQRWGVGVEWRVEGGG